MKTNKMTEYLSKNAWYGDAWVNTSPSYRMSVLRYEIPGEKENKCPVGKSAEN